MLTVSQRLCKYQPATRCTTRCHPCELPQTVDASGFGMVACAEWSLSTKTYRRTPKLKESRCVMVVNEPLVPASSEITVSEEEDVMYASTIRLQRTLDDSLAIIPCFGHTNHAQRALSPNHLPGPSPSAFFERWGQLDFFVLARSFSVSTGWPYPPKVTRSTSSTSWGDRGWLIMLRARYLASPQGKPERWRRFFCFSIKMQRKPAFLNGRAVANTVVGGASFDIKQANEASTSEQADEAGSDRDREFVKLVAEVTRINEEGVFCHLVMYL